jgi:hypothetical protein
MLDFIHFDVLKDLGRIRNDSTLFSSSFTLETPFKKRINERMHLNLINLFKMLKDTNSVPLK